MGGKNLLSVAPADVTALTKSPSVFTETSPDYPTINLTPESKETTHRDTGTALIRGDRPFGVCSEQGACLFRCWQKEVGLVTFHLERFYLTHFSEPTWLKDILLYGGWDSKRKQESVCLLEADAKTTWLKSVWWQRENDRRSDRSTNEEAQISSDPIERPMSLGMDQNSTNVRLYCAWPLSFQALCKVSKPPVGTLLRCKTCSPIQDPTNKTAKWVSTKNNMCYWNASYFSVKSVNPMSELLFYTP